MRIGVDQADLRVDAPPPGLSATSRFGKTPSSGFTSVPGDPVRVARRDHARRGSKIVLHGQGRTACRWAATPVTQTTRIVDHSDRENLGSCALAGAGCNFLMGLPMGDDVMLNYQSTSFHETAATMRRSARLPSPAPRVSSVDGARRPPMETVVS